MRVQCNKILFSKKYYSYDTCDRRFFSFPLGLFFCFFAEISYTRASCGQQRARGGQLRRRRRRVRQQSMTPCVRLFDLGNNPNEIGLEITLYANTVNGHQCTYIHNEQRAHTLCTTRPLLLLLYSSLLKFPLDLTRPARRTTRIYRPNVRTTRVCTHTYICI